MFMFVFQGIQCSVQCIYAFSSTIHQNKNVILSKLLQKRKDPKEYTRSGL
jgi:hypothetical protein